MLRPSRRPIEQAGRLVENAIQARGPGATLFSWTQGHAGWAWIHAHQENSITIANGQADMAAARGAHSVGLADQDIVIGNIASKLRAYESVVLRFQTHAAKLIQHDRALREAAGVSNEGRALIQAPSRPHRLCFTEGIPLNLMSFPPTHTHDSSCKESSGIFDLPSLHCMCFGAG